MHRKQMAMQDSIDNSKEEHMDLVKDLYELWTEWDEKAFNGFFSERKGFPSIRIGRLAESGPLGKFVPPRDKQISKYAIITLGALRNCPFSAPIN